MVALKSGTQLQVTRSFQRMDAERRVQTSVFIPIAVFAIVLISFVISVLSTHDRPVPEKIRGFCRLLELQMKLFHFVENGWSEHRRLGRKLGLNGRNFSAFIESGQG